MTKRVDLTKNGGFPATQYTFRFMQESYREAFGALASMIGNSIIAGVEINGGNATDGWISYNGEILPFVGGAVLPTFVIEELAEPPRTFQNNSQQSVYFKRQARFGNPGIAFSSLSRWGTVSGLWQRGDTKDVFCTPEELIDDYDVTGLGKNKRIGWAKCNGNNGTPNVNGRVIVAYDPNDVDFSIIGNMGGLKDVTLTIAQIPPHSHGYRAPLAYGDHDGGSSGYKRPNLPDPGNTSTAGGGQSHENMPPYFVMLKIMKL